jgi:hypothetical protein
MFLYNHTNPNPNSSAALWAGVAKLNIKMILGFNMHPMAFQGQGKINNIKGIEFLPSSI